MTSKGVEVNTVGCGGLCLITDFKGEIMPGVAFHGHGTTAYDSVSKKYVGSWSDSMSTGLAISEGTFDPATKKITGTMSARDMTGAMAKSRTVSESPGRRSSRDDDVHDRCPTARRCRRCASPIRDGSDARIPAAARQHREQRLPGAREPGVEPCEATPLAHVRARRRAADYPGAGARVDVRGGDSRKRRAAVGLGGRRHRPRRRRGPVRDDAGAAGEAQREDRHLGVAGRRADARRVVRADPAPARACWPS